MSPTYPRQVSEAVERLSEDDRERHAELMAKFAAAGARTPEGWALSEIGGDAQYARFLFLRGVWRRMIDRSDEALGSREAARLLGLGATEEELRALVRPALYELAYDVLYLLGEPDGRTWGSEPQCDVEPHDPRWVLMECLPDGTLTDRTVGALYESLWDTDPSGREGQDWYGTEGGTPPQPT